MTYITATLDAVVKNQITMTDALELVAPAGLAPGDHFRTVTLRGQRAGNNPFSNRIDFQPDMSLVIHSGSKFMVPSSEQSYNVQFKNGRFFTAADFVLQVRNVFEIDDGEILGFRVARIDFATEFTAYRFSDFANGVASDTSG